MARDEKPADGTGEKRTGDGRQRRRADPDRRRGLEPGCFGFARPGERRAGPAHEGEPAGQEAVERMRAEGQGHGGADEILQEDEQQDRQAEDQEGSPARRQHAQLRRQPDGGEEDQEKQIPHGFVEAEIEGQGDVEDQDQKGDQKSAHHRIGQGNPLQPGDARSHALADEKRDQRQDQGRERGQLDQMRQWHCRPIPP